MQCNKSAIASAFAILLLYSPALADHTHTHGDGYDAYIKEDYDTAFQIWEEQADAGNANAQYNLGMLYTKGLGVDKNEVKAFFWLLMAAEAGNMQAQLNISARYAMGIGIQHNHVKAYKWLLISSSSAGLSEDETSQLIEDLINISGHLHHNLTNEERELAEQEALAWQPK